MSAPAPKLPTVDKNLRSSNKPKDPNAPKEKHWVVAACEDKVTLGNVKKWVGLKRQWGKDYEALDLNKDNFQKVNPKDKLYIHCHGGTDKGKQVIWIGEGEGKAVTPAQFVKYLEKQQLSKQHEVLKIAACYSNEFAKELHRELNKAGYSNITVYGYKKQFLASYGKNGGNLAGLEEPYIQPDAEGHWAVDPIKIREPGVADRCQARKNREGFGARVEAEKVAAAKNASAGTVTAASSGGSVVSAETPVASVPGRRAASASATRATAVSETPGVAPVSVTRPTSATAGAASSTDWAVRLAELRAQSAQNRTSFQSADAEVHFHASFESKKAQDSRLIEKIPSLPSSPDKKVVASSEPRPDEGKKEEHTKPKF